MRALITLLFWVALVSKTGAEQAGTLIVTTNHALALLVAAIAPHDVEVRSITSGATDPHHVRLLPSQIKEIGEAQLVFWQGPELDAGYASAIGQLPAKQAVDLAGANSLVQESPPAALYGHTWLDPRQAVKMTGHIAERLVDLLPGKAAEIESRVLQFRGEITSMAASADLALANAPALEFLALHDAYQPLQQRFGLLSLGFIYNAHGSSPGARQLWQLEQSLKSRSSTCLFTQPQFPLRFLDALNLPDAWIIQELDPMASEWAITRNGFLEYYQDVLHAMLTCLQAVSGDDN